MEIHEREAGKVTILDVQGRLTLGDGDQLLRDTVNSLVRRGRKKLLLNLADVPYIDTGGLAAIVHTYATVTRQHGSFKLLNLTSRIRGLLAITRLLAVFEIFDNEADAVTSFAGDNE